MSKETLPAEYIPFREQLVCGNRLVNGSVPISVDGHAIFLIGKGEENPRVWLLIPSGSPQSWNYEIRDGNVDDSAYRLYLSPGLIKIHFGPHLILRAEIRERDVIEIDHLDFSHFGLNIHGDHRSLQVGSQRLVGNVFEGIDTMVAVS